jgi:hypothetical protein
MSYTTTDSANTLKKWETNYFKEFVRESGFMPYMGTGSTNPFVVKKQLIEGGQVISIPLVYALTGDGKGTDTLVGQEESLVNRGYDLKPYWHRHAVAMKKSEKQNATIDLANAARDMLKVWDMDTMRDDIINALSSVVESSGAYNELQGHAKEVPFAEATTANKNTWAAANQTRIVPGATLNNYNATFATMTANLDTTNDTLTVEKIQLMKRLAKRRDKTTGQASVRPIRTGEQGREFFVCFAHRYAFRDLASDMETINLDGRPRNVDDNPIFQDGDLLVDGVVIREIPEIADYGSIGSGSATVVPTYFCGAQALGIAWGQMPRVTRRKEDDYEFIDGVGTESLYSVEKLRYVPPGGSSAVDYGMITGLFATAAD